MPLIVNLRHLEEHNVTLCGELPVKEMDLETGDEMIQVAGPLQYDIEVQKLEEQLAGPRRVAAGVGLSVRAMPETIHPRAGIEGVDVPSAV